MSQFLESVVTIAVRRALSFIGGGVVLSDTDIGTIVGALLIVGDLLLQAYRHHQAQQGKVARRVRRSRT